MAWIVVRIIAALAAAYLIGAVPWSLIIGKQFYRVDLRERGSGNLGATNVFRVLGPRAGVAALVLDIGKGALAVAIGMVLVGGTLGTVGRDWALIATGMAAVVGHSYSPYIKLRGGKGVATAAGAVAVLMPLALPVLLLTFIGVILVSKMVSLGSVVIALEFPVLIWILYGDRTAFLVFSPIFAALVLWRHRGNIVRIFRGEESKISLRRSPADEGDSVTDSRD